jgi:hypothetical protein
MIEALMVVILGATAVLLCGIVIGICYAMFSKNTGEDGD